MIVQDYDCVVIFVNYRQVTIMYIIINSQVNMSQENARICDKTKIKRWVQSHSRVQFADSD